MLLPGERDWMISAFFGQGLTSGIRREYKVFGHKV
jgi:hypothetical protein